MTISVFAVKLNEGEGNIGGSVSEGCGVET